MPRELRRSRYGAGLVLGVTVLVSGCGGGQSDSQSDSAQVHSVVQRYQAAVVDHNGPKMCLLLSGAAKRQLASINAGKALDCISFTKLFARAVAHDPRALSRIRDARIGTPKVTGDRATVIVQEPGAGAREITLVKTQTGWRISLPPLKSSAYFDLRGGPRAITVEPPSSNGDNRAQFYLGRTVAAQSGCLACHRIGQAGNKGPGPDLTHVGSTSRSARLNAPSSTLQLPCLPSANLPKAKLRALVVFLSDLQ